MAVTPNTPNERLTVREKIGYGLGDTPSNLFWKTFEFFLMYSTPTSWADRKAAGTMLLVTRIWDAVNDPLIGYLADRTRTSWDVWPYLV